MNCFVFFTVDIKPVAVKTGKEDRKVQKEDKKAAAKEKDKGKALKEVSGWAVW